VHQSTAQLRQDDIPHSASVEIRRGHRNSAVDACCGGLIWFHEIGVGYFPVTEPADYDEAYFNKYRSYRNTAICRALNDLRVAMVARHWDGHVIDIGIGDGAFIEARKSALTLGFDINKHAIHWLGERGLYASPYDGCDAVTCWDSFEHLEDFSTLLITTKKFIFMSLPIFRDADHAYHSKHFRPDEHFWYFTTEGLVNVMELFGWEMVEHNNLETVAGREDIGSFVFRK
jgi:hypothetical protein